MKCPSCGREVPDNPVSADSRKPAGERPVIGSAGSPSIIRSIDLPSFEVPTADVSFDYEVPLALVSSSQPVPVRRIRKLPRHQHRPSHRPSPRLSV
jgi:hypothetical protein